MHLRNLFLQHLAQTSESPLMLEIEKAEGMYLYDTQGKKYMDLIAGIAVSNLGHCHPNIIKAIHEQTQKYMHVLVYGEMVHSPQVLLAKKITELLPKNKNENPNENSHKNLESVYFVNSGTEATEVAMKLAKRYTGRQEIISCFEAYHGSTQGALSIGGGEHYKQNYRPLLPETNQIWYGSFLDLEKITKKTACIIIEVIQGEAGVKIACRNYFEALRKKCDEVGALLIFDEVQTGFGRTGKMFAMEHYGVLPDIVMFAKGMGGGLPIGAVVSTQKIMSVLKNNPILGHITTFGGNPVCCASALANINTLLEKDKNGNTLIELAEEKGLLFRKYLQENFLNENTKKRSKIREVRQIGLMMAIQFDDFLQMKNIIDKLISKGFLTDWFLYCDNAMRLAPPLIITEEQIKEACEIIIEVSDEVI